MYVSLLLEMFSNIIQYQYGGNAHLIYAIVRRKEASVAGRGSVDLVALAFRQAGRVSAWADGSKPSRASRL